MPFSSREAESRFQSLKADKTLAQERGANYLGGSPYFITVRGKNVQCSASEIRKVYDLEPTMDEYNELVTKEGSYNLKCSRFRPEARVWFHFLYHRLLPTLHTQTISRERAFLLYCLLEGKQIDVDALIYEELFTALKSTTGNLWFPALITELCRYAEVIFDASEERDVLPSPISVTVVQRILQKAQPKVPQATPANTSAVPTDRIASEAPASSVPASAFYAMTTNIADFRLPLGPAKALKNTQETMGSSILTNASGILPTCHWSIVSGNVVPID
ncbi:hypothetical protein K1719_028062 [Acacia pycnantha]|nr:hypothetical protein K1719_028062 [Acacia pycnantha]